MQLAAGARDRSGHPAARVRPDRGRLCDQHSRRRPRRSSRDATTWAIFNPGKNKTQQSRLRLVNLGEADAIADVKGTDDDGIQSEGTVQLTVPKGGACTVTSEELESGETDDSCGCAMSGDGLGAGEGKWQLSVTTDQSIQVMSVLKTPEHLTNLSTVRYAGFAPPDGAAFNARFVGRRVRATDGSGYVDFVSSGRFSESDNDGMYEGDYNYENEGPNSGTLVFDYEDGEKCTALAAFDSFIAGTTLSVCEDGGVFELPPIRSWVLEGIGPAGMAPADQAAFDALVDSRRLAHDDASGLGVAFVFVSPGEFSRGTGGSERTGTYVYENTGRSLGTVELTYAGGGTCTLGLVFEADDSGRVGIRASRFNLGGSSSLLQCDFHHLACSHSLARVREQSSVDSRAFFHGLNLQVLHKRDDILLVEGPS